MLGTHAFVCLGSLCRTSAIVAPVASTDGLLQAPPCAGEGEGDAIFVMATALRGKALRDLDRRFCAPSSSNSTM
jgi:hypothetical protein